MVVLIALDVEKLSVVIKVVVSADVVEAIVVFFVRTVSISVEVVDDADDVFVVEEFEFAVMRDDSNVLVAFVVVIFAVVLRVPVIVSVV